MNCKFMLVILLVLCMSGCSTASRYPDTGRAPASGLQAEVMQGLEHTVENILQEQDAVNSDVQELQHLKISTRQYYGQASPASSAGAYTEAHIDLLTEEDISFAQEVLLQQGCWDGPKTDAEAWKAALTAYQIKMGLPVNGRLDGTTISKMRSQG